jgi:hypothetical protein
MSEDASLTTVQSDAPVAESTAPTQETAPVETPDPYAAIESLDADELVKRHKGLQGKIGAHADRRYREQVAKDKATWEAEFLAKMERQETARLIESGDILAVGERAKAQYDAEKATEAAVSQHVELRAQLAGELTNETYKAVQEWWTEDLPAGVQKALTGKQFGGRTPAESIKLALKEAWTLASQELRAEIAKDMRPAVRKEVLTEINSGDPTLDLGSGSPGVNGAITIARLSEMTTAERTKYRHDHPDAYDNLIRTATYGR